MGFNNAAETVVIHQLRIWGRVGLQNHNRKEIIPPPLCALNYYQFQLSKPNLGRHQSAQPNDLFPTPKHTAGWINIHSANIHTDYEMGDTSNSIKPNPNLSNLTQMHQFEPNYFNESKYKRPIIREKKNNTGSMFMQTSSIHIN